MAASISRISKFFARMVNAGEFVNNFPKKSLSVKKIYEKNFCWFEGTTKENQEVVAGENAQVVCLGSMSGRYVAARSCVSKMFQKSDAQNEIQVRNSTAMK